MPNRIVFSSDGSTLFHSARSGMVVLWNIAAAQVVARCQGYLIGIARDGHTFLTMSGAETFAWDMQTGSSVALNVVVPDQYARYQRTIICKFQLSNRHFSSVKFGTGNVYQTDQ
jgi:hypothetical protein